MDTGSIATAVIAAVIAFCFFLGVKRIVRNFAKGDCGSGCSGCSGACSQSRARSEKF